jgi:hypothetical protein
VITQQHATAKQKANQEGISHGLGHVWIGQNTLQAERDQEQNLAGEASVWHMLRHDGNQFRQGPEDKGELWS